MTPLHVGRICFIAILIVSGCRPHTSPVPVVFREIENPAGPGSQIPYVHATPDGRVLMSWLEAVSDSVHALRFAWLQDSTWSPPRTIAQGRNWFINWADFPSVVASGDVLVAHVLVRRGDHRYAYDVQLLLSTDGGLTWQPLVTPHRDGTATEHGFVSLVPRGEERVTAVWLDGRHYADPDSPQQMTLRAAVLDSSGRMLDEYVLDERVCDCCQTAAVSTPTGVLVAYRDRSDAEVRDIATVHFEQGRWSPPKAVFRDGWVINGCPVNGPALASQDQHVTAAWYTEAHAVPRVLLSFSDDAGNTFLPPVTVDDIRPLGRVDVVLLPDRSALVSWLARNDDEAGLYVRRIDPDGTSTEPMLVAETVASRDSGFPRMARAGRNVVLAWTLPGPVPSVRTALAVVADGD